MTALEAEGSERGGKGALENSVSPFWYVKKTGKEFHGLKFPGAAGLCSWAPTPSGAESCGSQLCRWGHLCVVVAIDRSLDSILKVIMEKYRRDH